MCLVFLIVERVLLILFTFITSGIGVIQKMLVFCGEWSDTKSPLGFEARPTWTSRSTTESEMMSVAHSLYTESIPALQL